MTETKSTDWFETWFDTPYYHKLYKHRDKNEAEKFINNLLQYLNLSKDSKCLDLACGKGRHSLFLNANGLDVTGLDLSENSIEIAKSLEKENLRFDVHDMREVYLKKEYDAIFNLFTSFGYFDSDEDNLRVLNAVYEMLKDKGVFIIDFMNIHFSLKNLVPSELKSVDGLDFDIERTFDGTHIHKFIRLKDKGKTLQFKERVQALTKTDFEVLFEKSGFVIKDVFGDFSLNSYNKENSKRLIIIAEKA